PHRAHRLVERPPPELSLLGVVALRRAEDPEMRDLHQVVPLEPPVPPIAAHLAHRPLRRPGHALDQRLLLLRGLLHRPDDRAHRAPSFPFTMSSGASAV